MCKLAVSFREGNIQIFDHVHRFYLRLSAEEGDGVIERLFQRVQGLFDLEALNPQLMVVVLGGWSFSRWWF